MRQRRAAWLVTAAAVLITSAIVAAVLVALGPAGGDSSGRVTVAAGGSAELPGIAAVRVPAGAVDRDTVLTLSTGSGPAAPGGPWIPLGGAVRIELDDAALTGTATVELPVPRSSGGSALLATYFDDTTGHWTPAAAALDSTRSVVTVEATHFSWWRVYGIDTEAVRSFVTSLIDATFDGGWIAGVEQPRCDREAQARALVQAASLHTERMPWCVDLDDAGNPILRVVNGAKIATYIQMREGTELIDRSTRSLTMKYFGPVAEEWFAAQGGVRAVVLGPGESATFRVGRSGSTGIITRPSPVGYAADVADIGVTVLGWTYTGFAGAVTSDKERFHRALFASGQLAACLSRSLVDLAVADDPASAAAMGRAVSGLAFSCVDEATAKALPALFALPAVALVASVAAVVLAIGRAVVGGGETLWDIGQGRFLAGIEIIPARVEPPDPPVPPTVPAGPPAAPPTATAAPAPNPAPSPAPAAPERFTRTVSVPAGRAWTDTGVDLLAGDHFQIEASGMITIAGSDPGKYPNGATPGQGYGYCSAPAGAPAPGKQCHAMIARIGGGPPFEVLASVSDTAARGGRLQLGVNDEEFGDNAGAWQAVITVCRGGTFAQCFGQGGVG